METQTRKMVAIVGRPNVGKSALFNRLAGKQIAIVHDRPGVTRDRLIASCYKGAAPFDIMDTGGIGEAIEDDFNQQVQAEANIAIEVADLILFVVDGLVGLTPVDQELALTFRKAHRPVVLVVNKLDTPKLSRHAGEFAELGFANTLDVSAAHGHGIGELIGIINERLALEAQARPGPADDDSQPVAKAPIRLAIVGRPNAGKSSFVNAILGQQRTIVSSVAGTTRDAIDIPCEIGHKQYTLVDTAGLRRKAKIHDMVESHSAMSATRSIRRADICLLMVDCTEITMQDRKIAQLIVEERKPCIILLNKFDLYHPTAKLKDRMEELLETAGSEFFFLRHAPLVALSAKESKFLDKAFRAVESVVKGAKNPPGTGVLNRLIQRAVKSSPQIAGASGRTFNILYATLRKLDEPLAVPPPEIVLFANRADKLQESYLRHLESVIREEWPAPGLPFTWTIKGKKRESAGERKDARPKTERTTGRPKSAHKENRPKRDSLSRRAPGRKGGAPTPRRSFHRPK
jgi:GTP-binding protein